MKKILVTGFEPFGGDLRRANSLRPRILISGGIQKRRNQTA